MFFTKNKNISESHKQQALQPTYTVSEVLDLHRRILFYFDVITF